jgi:hypothetical protein
MVIATQKTIFEIMVPRNQCLELNHLLVCKDFGEKWKRYNITIFIVGFKKQEGGFIFHPECYSANNLPTETIESFIVQISSLEEITNKDVIQDFINEVVQKFFKTKD